MKVQKIDPRLVLYLDDKLKRMPRAKRTLRQTEGDEQQITKIGIQVMNSMIRIVYSVIATSQQFHNCVPIK